MRNSISNNLAQKIFNINFKSFQIPERRGTTISPPIFKRYSNLQDTILPSETDLKAIKATDSFIPPTDFNIDNLLIDELKLDIAVSSKSKTSSISKTSNDRSSISWKFVINIKDEDNDDK